MAVSFSSQHIVFNIKNKSKLKKWIGKIIEKEKRNTGNISYIFTNDETLFEINKKFLKHDSYTDIITFDYSEAKKLSADIFISIERVKENAKKFEVNFETELHRVI